jgi:hypothetical protein
MNETIYSTMLKLIDDIKVIQHRIEDVSFSDKMTTNVNFKVIVKNLEQSGNRIAEGRFWLKETINMIDC